VLRWELSGSDLSSFGSHNSLGTTLTRLVLWDVDLAGDTFRRLAAQLPGLQSFTFACHFQSNSAATDDNDEDLVPDARWRLPEDVLVDVSARSGGWPIRSQASKRSLTSIGPGRPQDACFAWSTSRTTSDAGRQAAWVAQRRRQERLAYGPGQAYQVLHRLSGLVLDSESGTAPTLATPVGLRALSVGARVPAATVVGSLVWPSAATLTYLRVPLGTFVTLACGWQHKLGESRMPGLPSLATLKLEVEYRESGPGLCGGGGDTAVEGFAAYEGLPDACGSVTSLHVISCRGGARAPVPVSFLQ
ncbi:hypothetical protein HK405_000859, partial [Cladochytrium tenue]